MHGSHQHRCFLGRVPKLPVPGMEGFYLHLGSSFQSAVAFIGHDDPHAPGGINCTGTGVLIAYQGAGYLVTARHVAQPIGDGPFLVRVNRHKSGGSNVVRGDQAQWYYHPDETVDLAALPFRATQGAGFECLFISENDLLTDAIAEEYGIDVGNECYTVGLFRYLTGSERNLPVVFTGHVALWNESGIPIWNKTKNRAELVHGHLIQSHGLQGASGSPVLVRAGISLQGVPLDSGEAANIILSFQKPWLLGIFQGAWFLPPDEIQRAAIGANAGDTVPVGLGIVVPCAKIIELLEIPEVVEMRKKSKPIGYAVQTSDDKAKLQEPENAKHKEDFTRLLNAAAKTRESKD